ncbi:DUF2961 domain-containing protein [Fulvivirgaceae bacterium BMA10]|uniref:DUF2961 domain-containing protein n=1 Tax=Splendidivirga corallicola TaxID=3051826 RepID=A0ABT8L0L0_9BACT|nr:DUF2961 domain-containing protein [Fulvivirgaceae bacterium BMA10]
MKNSLKLTVILINVSLSLSFSLNAQERSGEVTLNTLLEELVNREMLSQHPDGLWTLHQASSYERLSLTPEDPEGWYANHDWNHFERLEENSGRSESVLLDVKGPGVITRFWMAGDPNRKSTLRFYIDGDTIPVWEADHPGALIGENKEVGRLLSSRSVEQDQLPINKGARPGHNLYFPIPFDKGIKITSEEPAKRPGASNAIFYNINYRLYHGKVSMESFDKSTINKYKDVLDEINSKLLKFQEQEPAAVRMPGEEKVDNAKLTLQKDDSGELSIVGDRSIIRTLLSINADDMDKAVKDLWIQFFFDDKSTVDVPVGLFFGIGDQLVPTSDWYRKVDTDGNMASFWVMPFQKKAKVRLINKGDQTVSIDLSVASRKTKWTNNSMYFYGNYSQKLEYQITAKKGEDYNFITISSKGIYVGDTYQIQKYRGGWWGEGDEKIYVDGKEFPDHFGTGTEDYYGYAWGHPETFAHPYIGQPIGQANLLNEGGITVNSRVRGLDAIPFNKSLKFDMEQWAWFSGEIDLKWACFWYGP